MASLFSKPDYPEPPTPDNSAAELAAAAQRERLARGRASTIVTSVGGLSDEPLTSTNVLLGS
jgi:hypothetical protein